MLEEVLQQADLISIHLPLTSQTHQLINREALDKMPPHALLINTARGGIIDQKALTEALSQGRIGGFAADVLAVEPPAADDPLLKMTNVLVTPHSASLTARTYNEMCLVTVKNTIALLSGKPIEDRYIFNRKDL
jgi:D-3-phosphoglycerate dehydrogenase